MRPEIEKLIDLALADGKITEKERNVILKKATELGVDTDEVEMVIDGKKHLNEKKSIGSQIKCPACGNRISGLSKTCACGYVFNTGTLNESKSLEASIETLENLIIQVRGLSSSSPKEIIESLIAKVEKEIRYIKTRYADNNDIKKLLAELESLSARYINKAVKRKKNRTIIISICVLFVIFIYGYFFIKSRMIEYNQLSISSNLSAKIDSISNPKLKEHIRSTMSLFSNWDEFKPRFFESYPDYNNGYIAYLKNKFGFSEETNYKIAENQFNKIKDLFESPIDFILFDDRNDFRNLDSTFRVDSLYISTLISKNRWQLKKEIDSKIDLLQNEALKLELTKLNDIDSLKQASLVFWNNDAKNFILYEQNGHDNVGFIKANMVAYRTDKQTATKYCQDRLNFFSRKFKSPIDFFVYRNLVLYNPNSSQDIDDIENIKACQKKFNIKD